MADPNRSAAIDGALPNTTDVNRTFSRRTTTPIKVIQELRYRPIANSYLQAYIDCACTFRKYMDRSCNWPPQSNRVITLQPLTSTVSAEFAFQEGSKPKV
jgi:hypothetical protein